MYYQHYISKWQVTDMVADALMFQIIRVLLGLITIGQVVISAVFVLSDIR